MELTPFRFLQDTFAVFDVSLTYQRGCYYCKKLGLKDYWKKYREKTKKLTEKVTEKKRNWLVKV